MGRLARRKPHQLSGGQQQRVALARALVLEPTVLLLDEPMGALDAKLRKQLQLELRSLQQDVGTTFVYVTHDQEEALTMSDRLAVLDQGKVMQVGTPSEVYSRPPTPTSRPSSAPPTSATPIVSEVGPDGLTCRVGETALVVAKSDSTPGSMGGPVDGPPRTSRGHAWCVPFARRDQRLARQGRPPSPSGARTPPS